MMQKKRRKVKELGSMADLYRRCWDIELRVAEIEDISWWIVGMGLSFRC